MPNWRKGIQGPQRRRTRKPKGLSTTQVKSVRKIAQKVAMAIPETKVFGFLDENRQLIHNKTDYLPNFLECKQGTADPNDIQGASNRLVRLGDEFYLKNVNIRLCCELIVDFHLENRIP